MQSVDIKGGDEVLTLIVRSGPNVMAAVLRGLGRIANACHAKSVDYAPRSPTRTVTSATLKVKRRSKAQRTPGGLERSIEKEVGMRGNTPTAAIFIAANAPAGDYAKRIHDEKGITWWNRGPGTKAKGDQADEKFIERAIRDSREYFERILDQEIGRAIRK